MAEAHETLVANSFFLNWEQEKIKSISEVSGIEDESDVVELIQVADKGKVVVTKGLGANPLKAGKLTVKYSAFKGDPLRIWREKIVAGKMEGNRKDVTLHVFTPDNSSEIELIFKRAWPSKYAWSSFTAKGNDAVMVTVTLEHEGMSITGYNG
jgi:phage tail-like protein